MESKICTYSEKNIRLQLVRIQEDGSSDMCLEIRLNRKVLFRMFRSEFVYVGTFARLMFNHYVHEISINRRSNLSHMTL